PASETLAATDRALDRLAEQDRAEECIVWRIFLWQVICKPTVLSEPIHQGLIGASEGHRRLERALRLLAQARAASADLDRRRLLREAATESLGGQIQTAAVALWVNGTLVVDAARKADATSGEVFGLIAALAKRIKLLRATLEQPDLEGMSGAWEAQRRDVETL